jgi:hypothetical protein
VSRATFPVLKVIVPGGEILQYNKRFPSERIVLQMVSSVFILRVPAVLAFELNYL